MKQSNLLLMCFIFATTITMAQEKKRFTMDDLVPGGATYFNAQPKNVSGVQWWGDLCIYPEDFNLKTIDPKNKKEEVIVSLQEVNKALDAAQISRVRSLTGVKFPYADETLAVIPSKEAYVCYDFAKKQVVATYPLQAKAANIEVCYNSKYLSYTLDNKLYVVPQGGKAVCVAGADEAPESGIVYGQAVHRLEFAIKKGTFWSPNGNKLAFYRMDESMVDIYPQVDISSRIASYVPDRYPMAGETSHIVTVGVYTPSTGETIYLKAGDPFEMYYTCVSWSPDEKHIYMVELNRDQNHAQMVRYNAITGEREEVIYEERHPKYVEPRYRLEFLPWDSSKFLFRSQRDGFNHLYLFDTSKASADQSFKEGKGGGVYREMVKVTPITEGDWLVRDFIGFNAKKKEAIYISTEASPMQQDLYAVNVTNGKRRALGYTGGMHTVQLSASGSYVIDNYTSPTVPRNIDIVNATTGVATNLWAAADPWADYQTPQIEVGTIKAADGETDLYYRMIKPTDFDPNKKYPVIIYVYGGPQNQQIKASFHYAIRGWDVYMADQGYIMFTVDSRGSDNRGHAFESATFRHLGDVEMQDQMKGVEFLKSLPYVDGSRMGVHGWSFGGFMTTNLMCTYPGTFKVAVAGGPVIDWKYYEVMYGERYMDTPQTNPEGYASTSLLNKVQGLDGRLLLIYGGNDPICVPQHTLSFIKACVEHGKHPDMFIYPGHGHNVSGKDRKHLYEHITQYFVDFL